LNRESKFTESAQEIVSSILCNWGRYTYV